MPPVPAPEEWHIPKMRASFGFEPTDTYLLHDGTKAEVDAEFYDVKFYPYSPPDAPPVFAAVSKRHIIICRLNETDKENPCEVIRFIRDVDNGVLNCSCTWSKDAKTGRAYICVAGKDAKIKVYNVREGTLHTSLVGHGGEINDLATSPANPQIIASASDDTTVRLWSLDPVHAKQPCVCLLGGEGHSWNLLSVAFHSTGRYLLSSGHDQIINLWTMPDIPKEHMDVPIVVYYPHFSTSEIHQQLVDCVAFYGDCVLSRACHEDRIVLWRIEGFCSDDPPPSPDLAPTAHDTSKQTRSAFAPLSSTSGQTQYTRLLQFHTAGCSNQFFLRFSLYNRPGQHPILGFCNAGSKIYFWDFARLTSYHEFTTALRAAKRDHKPAPARPPWLQPIAHRKKEGDIRRLGPPIKNLRESSARERDNSDRDSMASGANDTPDPSKTDPPEHDYSPETWADWDSKYKIDDPHATIKPHKSETVKGGTTVGRQVAWSPAGEWCVIVGSNNRAIILHRWPLGAPGTNVERQGKVGAGTSQAPEESGGDTAGDTQMEEDEGEGNHGAQSMEASTITASGVAGQVAAETSQQSVTALLSSSNRQAPV